MKLIKIILIGLISLPIFAYFVPVLKIGFTINPMELFMVMFIISTSAYMILNKQTFKVSQITLAIIYLYFYLILNSLLIQGEYNPIQTLYKMVFNVLFLVCLDNVELDLKFKKITRTFFGIFVFVNLIVVLIQVNFFPFFLIKDVTGAAGLTEKLIERDAVVRYPGLFANTPSQAAILTIAYLILFTKTNQLFKILQMTVISIAIYFSMARYQMLGVIVIIMFYAVFRFKNRIAGFLALSVFSLFAYIFFTELYFDKFSKTKFYQERLTQGVTGRSDISVIFFNEYFFKKPIFGYGRSSSVDEDFQKYWHVIHTGLDAIFHGGLVAVFLILFVLYKIYCRTMLIYKYTNMPEHFSFIIVYFIIVFTMPHYIFYDWGHLLGFIAMKNEYDILRSDNKQMLANRNISDSNENIKLQLYSNNTNTIL